MAIMRNLIPRKQKEISSASSPPRYTRLSREDHDGQVRRGRVPVMVGADGARERFFIPTHFVSHPIIVSLLESSANEFGYRQEGVLQILAEPDCFREIVRSLK